jgi:hypothetical protein
MGGNAKKINFTIEEDIGKELERLIPAGKRSAVVNIALRKELEAIRRKKAVEKLASVSFKGKKFSNREIIQGLAKDRKEH